MLSVSGVPPLTLAALPSTSEYLDTSIDALAVTGVVWSATAGVENVVLGLGRPEFSGVKGNFEPNGDSGIELLWASSAYVEENVVDVVYDEDLISLGGLLRDGGRAIGRKSNPDFGRSLSALLWRLTGVGSS